MQRLGGFLEGMAKGREQALLGRERTELARLTRLPSTNALTQERAELTAAHQRHLAELEVQSTAEHIDDVEAVRRRLTSEFRKLLVPLQVQLEEAQQRDDLQLARPPGCFCLGVGGRGHLLPMMAIPAWSEWCSCPEALEMQAAVKKLSQEVAIERAADEAKEAAANLQNRLRQANLPDRLKGKSWSDFEHAAGKQTALIALRTIADGGTKQGAYLYGDGGTGKSTLAFLAVRQWVLNGGSALYILVPDLLDMLRPGGREMAEDVADNQNELMRRLCMVGLLVLDDLGAQRETGWTRERLFLIINRRYDAGRPTIYTSNYNLGKMSARLAGTDEKVEGERIGWRIKETCELVLMGGKNYRADDTQPEHKQPAKVMAAPRLPYADNDAVEELSL